MKISWMQSLSLALVLGLAAWACDGKDGCTDKSACKSGGCDKTASGCDKAVGDKVDGGCDKAAGGCDKAAGGCDKAAGGCDKAAGGCDKAEGGCDKAAGGCDKAAGGCDKATAGCGKQTWNFAFSGVSSDADRLALVQRFVQAGMPISDFAFEGNSVTLSFKPGALVGTSQFDKALAGSSYALDHQALVLPSKTYFKLGGMKCGNCVAHLKDAFASVEGVKLVEADVGKACLAFDRNFKLAEVEAIFAEKTHFSIECVAIFMPETMTKAVPAETKPAKTDETVANETRDGVIVCPISGGKISAPQESLKIAHEGKVWYVCCAGCIGKLKAKLAGK